MALNYAFHFNMALNFRLCTLKMLQLLGDGVPRPPPGLRSWTPLGTSVPRFGLPIPPSRSALGGSSDCLSALQTINMNRNSAIADKTQDAFGQYAKYSVADPLNHAPPHNALTTPKLVILRQRCGHKLGRTPVTNWGAQGPCFLQ